MRLYNIYGRLQNKDVTRFLIKWNKKSRSKVQFAVKIFLQPYWKGHVVYEEFPVFGSRMKVDIVNMTKNCINFGGYVECCRSNSLQMSIILAV